MDTDGSPIVSPANETANPERVESATQGATQQKKREQAESAKEALMENMDTRKVLTLLELRQHMMQERINKNSKKGQKLTIDSLEPVGIQMKDYPDLRERYGMS